MTDQTLFRGAGVALLSLFDDNGVLQVADTAAFAATLSSRGVAGILVAGTTGEFWTLSAQERLELFGAVRAAVPLPVPVLAGIGALNAPDTLALSRDVAATGVDAALCFTPPGQEPHAFLHQVRHNVGDLPLLAYHFPTVGYTPLPVPLLADLPIDGIKDSSGDAGRLVATTGVLRSGVYTGSALLASLAGAIDADGALLALANVAPAEAAAAVAGDPAGQRELARLVTQIAGDVPARAIKRLAAERFGVPAFCRAPALADAW